MAYCTFSFQTSRCVRYMLDFWKEAGSKMTWSGLSALQHVVCIFVADFCLGSSFCLSFYTSQAQLCFVECFTNDSLCRQSEEQLEIILKDIPNIIHPTSDQAFDYGHMPNVNMHLCFSQFYACSAFHLISTVN